MSRAHLEETLQKLVLDAKLTHRRGDALFNEGKHGSAQEQYAKAARAIVGEDFQLPMIAGKGDGGIRCDLYTDISHWDRVALMGCCNGIARCLLEKQDIEGALAWLEEVNAIYRNTYFAASKPLFDWIDYNLDLPEQTLQRFTGLSISSDTFLAIGNTATAAHRRWTANTNLGSLPASHKTREIKRITDQNKLFSIIQFRHPDPQLTTMVDLHHPGLQIRGSWAKLDVKGSGGPGSRMGFSSFIWNNHLYVGGGRKDSLGPFHRDLWCLDLNELKQWRSLPAYPIPMTSSGVFLGWPMTVYEEKAYLFTGRPQVDFFDLVAESWGSINTTYNRSENDTRAGVGTWPYPGGSLTDAVMEIVHGKMYVFGGTHKKTNIGCNLFMQLDLSTKEWRRLSGTVMAIEPDYSSPGPRKTPSSWVDKGKDRIFLMFGQCDREGAKYSGELHGADSGYAFEDFWSWDIKDGKWRRERMSGNPPCPRSEMACAYDRIRYWTRLLFLGVIIHASPHFAMIKANQFSYSYFADTFIYDRSSSSSQVTAAPPGPKWKQVLTRGYPTYRCQAHLITDPISGKTYLFGGFTNTDFVPSCRKAISRSFGDLWQLRIDEPGGCFENVDVEEEVRTAKAGPWQRCFNCASAGSWKKCGGTCKGRAFFCGPECLKEGWREHKEMHKCRKSTK